MATAATVNDLGGYALNPRGNLWFNEESSYGQKLLFKMGWRKGKGLGKKEDGIKENLKVKFKNTNSGLGYKDDSYNNVMKTEYESILKSLRDEYPQQETIKDCNKDMDENKEFKQRSKVVKSKIRYPKLYYGKDVSKYSEEDMKSIFICSLSTKCNEEKKSKDSEFCLKKEPENLLPKVQETYTSHLSISDYFNKKMKEKKDNEQMKRCSNKLKQEETHYSYNTADSKIKQEKTAFEKNKTDCEIKQESDFESYKAHFEINKERVNFQCHMSEKFETRPNREKCKKTKKNTKGDINGNDKDMFLLEGKDREGVIITNRKRKKLSEPSVHEGGFTEEKMENSNFMNDQLSTCKKRKKSHKKENCITSTDAEVVSTCQSDPHSDLVLRKKRKKSHRNEVGTAVDAVELLSVISLKDGVSANSELSYNLSAVSLKEVTEERFSNVNNLSTKKKKKLKNKIKSLKKLRSCLRSTSKEYAVKNVSFNENISYKIIDSNNESTGSLSDCQDGVQNDFKIATSASNQEDSSDSKCVWDGNHEHEEDSCDSKCVLDEHEMHSSGSTLEIQDSSLIEQNRTSKSDELETTSNEETETFISLSSLPSSQSSHYNSWVESQRLALKMKLYKNILNGIKKHDVLKTTNMLSIKGYGNCGI